MCVTFGGRVWPSALPVPDAERVRRASVREGTAMTTVADTAANDTATTEPSVAERLLESSATLSYDPLVEVDWDSPVEPGHYGASPEWSTLYGTPYWDELTEARRAELT